MANPSFGLDRMNQSVRRVLLLFGLAAVYFVAAKLGLRFAYINSSVTTVWPPAGIALAGFVLLGYRVWPAILGAAFLANVTTTGAVLHRHRDRQYGRGIARLLPRQPVRSGRAGL